MKCKKSKLSQNLINKYVNKKLTVKEISEITGIHVNTIYIHLRELGITRNTGPIPLQLPLKLAQQYSEGKLTVDEIAERLGCSDGVVYNEIKRQQISKPNHRIEKQERNLAVFRKYQNGTSICKLSDDFKISRQRIYQLVNNTSSKLKVEIRPKLSGNTKQITNIPLELQLAYRNREISGKKIAKQLNRRVATIYANLKLLGCKQRIKYNHKEMYTRWINGDKVSDLLKIFKCSYSGFFGHMRRYIRKNNLPTKRQSKILNTEI